jgi:hypothetical protein
MNPKKLASLTCILIEIASAHGSTICAAAGDLDHS